MTVVYSADSPYSATKSIDNRLDLLTFRTFNFESDDIVYTINQTYNNRPDLLAYDLYGRTGLWWVFAIRNPDIIVDPIWDFTTGITIYLPQLENLTKTLDG